MGIRQGRPFTMKKMMIIAAAVAGLSLVPSVTFGKEAKKKEAPVNVTTPGLQFTDDDGKDADNNEKDNKDGNKRSAEKVHENKDNRREKRDVKMEQKREHRDEVRDAKREEQDQK